MGGCYLEVHLLVATSWSRGLNFSAVLAENELI